MVYSKRSADNIRHPSSGKWLLRGSLIELRRRCGKTGCHCHDGDPHRTPALSYSQDGKTRMVTLMEKDLREVKAALRRYRQAVRQLEREAMNSVRMLKEHIRRRKQHERRNNQ